jgi:hypothetical protein
MKQDKDTKLEKAYIKAEKELSALHKQMRNQPWRKLVTPYQEGWNLIPVLREDMARSSKGPILQALIAKYGRPYVIKNPAHITKIRKKSGLDDVRAVIFHKPWMTGYAPCIADIDEREYLSLNEQQRKYFTETLSRSFYKWTPPKTYAFNLPRHYLVIKVEKRIITQVQDINPELLRREKELQTFLDPYYREKGYHPYQSWGNYFDNRADRRQANVDCSKELNEHKYAKFRYEGY